MYYIYALCDPRPDEAFVYVGITKNLDQYFDEYPDEGRLTKWICELESQNLEPIFVELERTKNKECLDSWIYRIFSHHQTIVLNEAEQIFKSHGGEPYCPMNKKVTKYIIEQIHYSEDEFHQEISFVVPTHVKISEVEQRINSIMGWSTIKIEEPRLSLSLVKQYVKDYGLPVNSTLYDKNIIRAIKGQYIIDEFTSFYWAEDLQSYDLFEVIIDDENGFPFDDSKSEIYALNYLVYLGADFSYKNNFIENFVNNEVTDKEMRVVIDLLTSHIVQHDDIKLLIESIYEGNYNYIQKALKSGCDINTKDELFDEHLIMHAIYAKDTKIIQLLITKGVDPDIVVQHGQHLIEENQILAKFIEKHRLMKIADQSGKDTSDGL